MEKPKYRPGLMIILVIFVVFGQIISVNYLKRELEIRIQQCEDAINTNSVLNNALINVLAEKKILEKNDVLNEAQKLSLDLKAMLEKIQNANKQAKASEPESKPAQ